ncbi:MFS transporter [Actinacidiphila acidipaludis]|uniref:MFS transporter n=1 Tax=Actinacidiphila acidipaludis TaxID=2873382 RepID=A0ABS7Q2Y0_9ACTN|nr:MFS transporter [Streptomyces acidipaludis]MBY8877494.1 MFS transporter [Streptomyces acidipaludis]
MSTLKSARPEVRSTAARPTTPATAAGPALASATPATVAPAPAQSASPAVRPAYRERSFVRLLIGEGASTVGDQVWYVALSWAAVRSGGPASAGAVMTASAIPRMLLLLFAGPLADRFDARRLMLGSDAARAVLMLGAAALAVLHPGVGMLVTVSLLLGAIDALFLPAAGSVRPRLLETDQLPQAAALRELALRGALVAGAPLGGLLIAGGGFRWACAVNALSFAVSMVAVWGIRPRPLPVESAAADAAAAPRTPYLRSLRDGLTAIGRNRVVGALLLVGLLTNLGFVGPMNVGLALLSDQRGWGAGGIGLLLAAFGIGAAVGAAVMLRWKVTRRIGVVVAVAVLAQAASLAAMAVLPALALSVTAAALVGVAGAVVGVSCGALGQARTPDELRGRISSVQTLLSLGVVPLAVAGTGVLAAAIGTVPALLASAGLEVLAAVPCLLVGALRTARLAGDAA